MKVKSARFSPAGTTIQLRFSFDLELKERIKANGGEFRKITKMWVIRPSVTTIDFLLKEEFEFSDRDLVKLDNWLAKLQKQQHNKEQRKALSKAIEAPEIDYGYKLNFTPFPFQNVPSHYMRVNKGSFFLMDSMGVGKTVQSLMATLMPEFQTDSVLIIGPANVTDNWRRELEEKFNIQAYVIDRPLDKLSSKYKYYIISWDRLKTLKCQFQTIIADECHFAKNKTTRRFKELKRLHKTCKYLMLLTGTPMQNRAYELFAPLSLIDKNCPTWVAFATKYCKLSWKPWGRDYSHSQNLPELHDYLYSTCAIRRTKEEVLKQLPPKTRQVIDLGKEDIKSESIFELYAKNAALKVENTEFIEYIDNLLESGEKSLLFYHHKVMGDKLEELCKAQNIKYIKIDGSVNAKERGKLVKKFQEDSRYQVAILSITAAGIGITLTAASLICFAELHFTPGNIQQCEDRACRIGQLNAVNVYTPVFSKFEHSLLKLILDKIKSIAIAIDGKVDSKNELGESSLLRQLSVEMGIPLKVRSKKFESI